MISCICRRGPYPAPKEIIGHNIFRILRKRHATHSLLHFLRHPTLPLGSNSVRRFTPSFPPCHLQQTQRRLHDEKRSKLIAGDVTMPRYLPSLLVLASICVIPCHLFLCMFSLVLCVLLQRGKCVPIQRKRQWRLEGIQMRAGLTGAGNDDGLAICARHTVILPAIHYRRKIDRDNGGVG